MIKLAYLSGFVSFLSKCIQMFLLQQWDAGEEGVDETSIPYRTKIRRTKSSKFWLGIENFVRRKILSVENFVQ